MLNVLHIIKLALSKSNNKILNSKGNVQKCKVKVKQCIGDNWYPMIIGPRLVQVGHGVTAKRLHLFRIYLAEMFAVALPSNKL